MKSREDEIKLAMFENMVELIKDTCNHQTNCEDCPFCYDNRQCAVMVQTSAEDAPCDW